MNLPESGVFRSFFQAGFESACHINRHNERLDMMASTQHDIQAWEDYALIRSMGIRTARDGVRWHLIDKGGGRYDFSSFIPMLDAALAQKVQIMWNLCHYGWPADVDLFKPEFVNRFARYCEAVARVIADRTDEVPFYTPVNEVSFLPWAIGHGVIFPFARGRDEEVKHQLVRAAVAGSEALWKVDRRARLVYGEPVIHVVPPRMADEETRRRAAGQRASQFSAWDLLSGEAHPELGGHARYLDIVGVNYYHSNQWEHPDQRMRWEDTPRDDRWMPFHQLLTEVYERYHRTFFISETSHFGVGRAPWIHEIAVEVKKARDLGVPVEGICLYPILDRHDWEDETHWHNSGLWDLAPNGSGKLRRVLNDVYARELRCAQALIDVS